MVGIAEIVERAIVEELRLRKPYLDKAEFVSYVTITVKLQDGPVPVRCVEYSDMRMTSRGPVRRTDR